MTFIERAGFCMVVCAAAVGCRHSDVQTLREARHDPAVYFSDDALRSDTLAACASGTAEQRAAWAVLDACRQAQSADRAKKQGWQPR